jgi:hypothetical protein
MSHNLSRHLAANAQVIADLGANLGKIPTEAAKIDLALFYAVSLGAATKDIRDLPSEEMIRLHQQIAERIALALRPEPEK